MATIKDEALRYIEQKTANIAELDKVPVDAEISTGTGKDSNGVDFSYKYIEIEQKRYRIPGIVIGSVKKLIEEYPNMTHFRVLKTGLGRESRYNTIPIGI